MRHKKSQPSAAAVSGAWRPSTTRWKASNPAISGYMGGHVPNPTYRAVCTGKTGHVEVVQVTFDPEVTSYREILEVFFAIHDPTSRDRQGNDAGPQYRSVIFYHSDQQRETAEAMIRELEAERIWSRPIVTEVLRRGALLRGRGLPPGVLREQSQSAVLRLRRRAQSGEIPREVRGQNAARVIDLTMEVTRRISRDAGARRLRRPAGRRRGRRPPRRARLARVGMGRLARAAGAHGAARRRGPRRVSAKRRCSPLAGHRRRSRRWPTASRPTSSNSTMSTRARPCTPPRR